MQLELAPHQFCFSSATFYVVRKYYCYVGWYKRINKHLKVCYKVVFHIYSAYQVVYITSSVLVNGKCLSSAFWAGQTMQM